MEYLKKDDGTTPESSRKCLNHYTTRAGEKTAITVIGQALDT